MWLFRGERSNVCVYINVLMEVVGVSHEKKTSKITTSSFTVVFTVRVVVTHVGENGKRTSSEAQKSVITT